MASKLQNEYLTPDQRRQAMLARGEGGFNLTPPKDLGYSQSLAGGQDSAQIENPQAQTNPMSTWAANTAAVGGLGLGIASFLDNKRTASLQRRALRDDIAAAREQNQRRRDVRDSWNQGLAAASSGV